MFGGVASWTAEWGNDRPGRKSATKKEGLYDLREFVNITAPNRSPSEFLDPIDAVVYAAAKGLFMDQLRHYHLCPVRMRFCSQDQSETTTDQKLRRPDPAMWVCDGRVRRRLNGHMGLNWVAD